MSQLSYPRILVAGASVRATVHSIFRAGGHDVVAADLFQDRDLGPAIRCRVQSGYQNLPAEARRLKPDVWMYTGALENRPDVVERIPCRLLGCDASTVRQVRDPWQVQSALAAAGLPTIELARRLTEVSHDGRWLCKPRASAGGRQIDVVRSGWGPSSRETWYFQQYVPGLATSAVFVASEGGCQFLGATQQWIGHGDRGADRFQYLGSWGPLPLTEHRRNRWERIGRALCERFSLQGLFGVDAIEARDEILPVEVNPRLTASVEVLERAAGWNAWETHWLACQHHTLPVGPLEVATSTLAAKRILFTKQRQTVSQWFLAWADAQNEGRTWPVLADLPAQPGSIPQGAPLLTAFVGPRRWQDAGALTDELHEWVSTVERALAET